MFPDIHKTVVSGTVIDKKNVKITKGLPHKRRQTLCKKKYEFGYSDTGVPAG